MIGIGLLVVFIVLVLMVLFRFYSFGKQSQSMSPKLGLIEGRLHSCPKSPNCVLSYATDAQHGIDAIQGGAQSFETLKVYLRSQPNVSIVSESDTYIHATFTSSLFKFVDDLELLLDGDVVQLRSASRVGYSDLNANRKRVELLRSVVEPD